MNPHETLVAEVTDVVMRVLHRMAGSTYIIDGVGEEPRPLDVHSLRPEILRVVTEQLKQAMPVQSPFDQEQTTLGPIEVSKDHLVTLGSTQVGLGHLGSEATALIPSLTGGGACPRSNADEPVANGGGQYFRQGTDQWGSV